jgi:MOSC domain-containing protein YiiM
MPGKYYLTNIYYGKVAERYGIETAIDKHHHVGLDRALHQYPSEHYVY